MRLLNHFGVAMIQMPCREGFVWVSGLGTVQTMVEVQLSDNEQLLAKLREARQAPHELEADTLERALRVYDDQFEWFGIYTETLDRLLLREDFSPQQMAEVNRVVRLSVRNQNVSQTIAGLAVELKSAIEEGWREAALKPSAG